MGFVRCLMVIAMVGFLLQSTVSAQDAAADVPITPAPQVPSPLPSGVLPSIQHYSCGLMLPCLVSQPRSFDADNSHDLVIGLHGYGSNPDIFATNWYAFTNPEFIYACPQAPYPAPQPQGMGYSWLMFDQGTAAVYDAAEHMCKEYIMGVVAQLSQEYNIRNIYLLGFSQGSALAYYLGITNPDTFSGVISIGGVFDAGWFTPEVLASGSELRVFITQGRQDSEFIITSGESALEMLTKYSYDVSFVEFEDGHTIPADILKQIELWIETPAPAAPATGN